MSLTASTRSIPGTLRQEVVIGEGHRLVTDEPEHLGGEGSAPAPHELLPAALGACIATMIVLAARARGWETAGLRVDVAYDHKATPRRFEVEVRVEGDLDAEQLERLEKVAESCPVRRALETGFEFEEHVRHAHTVPV